jgi:hypothetical protein
MKQARSLSLRRETLSDLTPAEMTAVNGGTHVGCGVTANCTHPSFDQSCPTLPINYCFAVDTGPLSDRFC